MTPFLSLAAPHWVSEDPATLPRQASSPATVAHTAPYTSQCMTPLAPLGSTRVGVCLALFIQPYSPDKRQSPRMRQSFPDGIFLPLDTH